MSKSHKGMGDGEWMARLRTFASSGVWPSSRGNRPAPRQKKWHNLYRQIETCPLQTRGQTTLFGGPVGCTCGFHATKQPGTPAASSCQATASSPAPAASSCQATAASSGLAVLAAAAASSSALATAATSSTLVASSSSTQDATASSGLAAASSSSSSSSTESPAAGEPAVASQGQSFLRPPPSLSADGAGEAAAAAASFWLPGELKKTIPVQDQRWIANTLFHSGRLGTDLKLWYEPPVPALIYHQTPTPDRFFTHRLMVWMPYHLWKVRVFCPSCGKQLTGCGVHKRARKVLDIDRYYLMITETLRCTSCHLNYLSTSQTVRDQLDLPHAQMFRLILTRKYACDIRVIRLLRDRTLGNSPARLARQLRENHGEEWLARLAHYMGECGHIANQPSVFPVAFQEPPEPIEVPSSRWLLSVYGRDILARLDHIKASITSTFGSVLKLDSTKKITKKLAGHGKGTALWVSSMGNEFGQILVSVLTAQEGPGLDRMARGIMERYRHAAVPPPVLLYVNCGCCVNEGKSKLQCRFSEWPDLQVRLDIWHFMRRLASGCTTDAHILYPTFMACLSACIFEWDAGDLALLRQAKREQLRQDGVPNITDQLVDSNISKKELGQFCRRRTRGEEATTASIERLLKELGGQNGRDLMGVPLLDDARMENIWRVQKRHVKCIQDVPGVQLYTAIGTTTKGGVVLQRYRCARGSTSLESFHCHHLDRFIPGTSANALNFQLYLLEGLNRWNQDRATAAVSGKVSPLLTYAGDLEHCINTISLKVFGRAFFPSFRPPSKYTGELLGVDYLLDQTGKPLNFRPDSEEMDDMLEDVNEGNEEQYEGFEEDQDDPSVFSSSLATSSSLSAPFSSILASSSALAVSSSSQAAATSSSTLAATASSTRAPPPPSPLPPRPIRPPFASLSMASPASATGPGATAGLTVHPGPFLFSGPTLFPGPFVFTGPTLYPAAAAAAVGPATPPAPPAPARKLTRRVLHNTCKKCGQFRTAETGHSQYKGVVYCPAVETLSKEQWLEQIKKT